MRMLVMMLVLVSMAACGGKLLGSRTPPDETTVIDGPTLSIPPDFALRPPSESEDYEAILRAQKTREAQAIIVGGPVEQQVVDGVNEADQWLLREAGMADSNIREQLQADGKVPEVNDKPSFWNRVLGDDKKE